MNVRLPSIHSEQELSEAHLDSSRMALERFMSMSMLDEQQKYQSKLKEEIGQKFTEFCQKNRMELKDKKRAESADACCHLNRLQKKLTEEKQSKINELKRKIRQRGNENSNNEEETEILKQQREEMKQERDQHKKDIIAITEGGSSFGKFLKGTGSVLAETLKVALVTVGGLAVIADHTLCFGTVGAMNGAVIGGAILPPGGILLGGGIGAVAGGAIGLGKGIYDAISFVFSCYDDM